VIPAVLLLATGLAVLAWRPCRAAEGHAPRAAVALLLSAAAAVWVGSFGIVVSLVAGETADALAACGQLWRQLLTGQLGWWQIALVGGWVLLFPARGIVTFARNVRYARSLERRLAVTATDLEDAPTGQRVRVVPCLSTPAVTLGMLRPTVLLDRDFWASATPLQRTVVLDHELGHCRGRHGLLEALAQLLLAALAPLPLPGVRECVRGHLEALADDAAARAHDRRTVGLVLGHVALAAPPPVGLGAASGSCLWRVERLVTDARTPWKERFALVAPALLLALSLVAVTADAAVALGPVLDADYCPF
jgi:hypothetical protein